MKTISLRELHNQTGKWMRRVKDEEEIIVTDRGAAIAVVRPLPAGPKMKIDWRNRDLLPGYAKALKAGKLKSNIDSGIGISEDRTSRDNSVAGLEE
jgi:prevent-host-death family protein